MDGIVLETTFLIDLERELLRERPGPAQALLESRPEMPLYTTWIVAGEIAPGPEVDRQAWREILSPLRILGLDEATAWEYGRAVRYLRRQGMLIGSNDLWIAASCLAHGLPLATANESHFQRVPGLEVLGY